MVLLSFLAGGPIFLGHLLLFGIAGIVCLAGIPRARRIGDPDTRLGLVALLATSGGWALAHVGYFLAPTPQLAVALYQVGLVIGFATVGPWLYFCSAYTGRSLHRNRTLRRVAVAVFLGSVLVKLTNPIHELYFTTEPVATPFPHLAVTHQPFHWLLMGLSYALATVGYFMLLELFLQVSHDAKPLAVLAGLTGLPLILDLRSQVTPALLEINYEPIGVAAFVAGVLFLYWTAFRTVRQAGDRAEPTIVLSDTDRIRNYNECAKELFPELGDGASVGESIVTVLPRVVEALETEPPLLEVEQGETTSCYRVTESPLGTGRARLGRLLTLTDVTHRERYRRELERQNERLERFASIVSHDLRNPLSIAMARTELARADQDLSHLEATTAALERMNALIDDVLTLARQGQPIGDTEPVTLSSVADRSWQFVETVDAELVIEHDLEFVADRDRLQQLIENLFRNSVEHGGPDVTIYVGALDDATGFHVEDDGPGIPDEERSEVFGSGYSTAEDGTGFGLAIVEEIADAHGWEIGVTGGRYGGARFEITGVTRPGDPVETPTTDSRSPA
jgi:signal transduction histidine kinase